MSYTIENVPITTPDDVQAHAKRRYLNFDYEVRYSDTVLTGMISDVQGEIERQTGMLFNAQGVTVRWHGEELNGGTLLQTPFYPVLLKDGSGTPLPVTLTINGTELVRDTDYHVTDENIGTIRTTTQLPTAGYNNVILEYNAGYIPTLQSAKELCELIVVYTMLLERETPPNLQNIIEQTEVGVYNKGSDKTDRLISFVFDIQTKYKKLPRKLFPGIIIG